MVSAPPKPDPERAAAEAAAHKAAQERKAAHDAKIRTA